MRHRFARLDCRPSAPKPAAPTMPETTVSTSGMAATASIASVPVSKVVFAGNLALAALPGRSVVTENGELGGKDLRLFRQDTSRLRWAVNANTANRWPSERTTSRQLVPMEPVEPNTAICFIRVESSAVGEMEKKPKV
jgi:hypothetical protein